MSECIVSGAGEKMDCMICGKPLVYGAAGKMRKCSICGREFFSHEECEAGHYVCSECHAGNGSRVLGYIKTSTEKNPGAIMEAVWNMPEVHLFGPEHHKILPCVLLSAYRNCGGNVSESDFDTAWERGSGVPGGACGYWGVCGASIGMGIFFSVILGDTPLNPSMWPLVQSYTSGCLKRISEIGGPRCCKRTCRTAINVAAEIVAESCGINMPVSWKPCGYSAMNRECLRESCPYHG